MYVKNSYVCNQLIMFICFVAQCDIAISFGKLFRQCVRSRVLVRNRFKCIAHERSGIIPMHLFCICHCLIVFVAITMFRLVGQHCIMLAEGTMRQPSDGCNKEV